MAPIKAVYVVHATWCPHCHPTTVEPLQEAARELGVPLRSYDIDKPDEVKEGDELVRRYGDWSEDYLVPQVFVETSGGEVRHVLTGYSEAVELTERAVKNLLSSPYFKGDRPA